MKRLALHIYAELQIPDDWEVVDHPSGMKVLKIGDQYVDFDIAPLATASEDVDATWSDENQDLTETILDTVTGLDTEFEVSYTQ